MAPSEAALLGSPPPCVLMDSVCTYPNLPFLEGHLSESISPTPWLHFIRRLPLKALGPRIVPFFGTWVGVEALGDVCFTPNSE